MENSRNQIDRPLLLYRIGVFVFSLVFLLTHCRCAPVLKAYPKWPTTPPLVMQAPQQNPRCGKQAMQDEPKSLKMKVKGYSGIWMSQKRAECLLARAKIGRTCRANCFTLLAKHKQADDHVQRTITVAWQNYVTALTWGHKKQIRELIVINAAVSLGTALVGGLVGWGIGALQK